MNVNLTAIDARIRKLQKLRELLNDEETLELISDPEVMAMLQPTNGANGSKPMLPEPVTTDDTVNADAALATPAEGSLRRRVLDIARTTGRFEARYIVEILLQTGYSFDASDPMIAVNTALRALIKKKFIKLVRAGSGRMPHTYEARKEQLQLPK